MSSSEREYKSGNEFLPYHPSASHVDPQYRDGWNHCYAVARADITQLEARIQEVGRIARENRSRTVVALQAEVEALRKDKERAERNRDMWKGQCERQALQLGHIHETLYSIERSTELRTAHALADAALTGRPWTQAGGPIDAAMGAVARKGE